MSIQYLLAMRQGHSSDAPRDIVQWRPQCFDDFPINLFSPWYVARREAGQTGILMSMDVEEAYTSTELQRVRDGQLRTPFHSFLQVNFVLAHDIIHHQCNRNTFHVVGQSLAEAIVHVDLPDGEYEYAIGLTLVDD